MVRPVSALLVGRRALGRPVGLGRLRSLTGTLWAGAALAVALALGTGTGVAAASAGAGRAPGPREGTKGTGNGLASTAHLATPPYYVAIGASESVGFQPTTGHPHGQRTDHGYANDLAAIERQRWPGLRLYALGCPGITVQAALHGGGACHYRAGSQVQQAVDFIRAHRRSTVLGTVDLGFNDLWPCLVRDRVDHHCVADALRRVSRTLPVVLRRLEAAGGRRFEIVGVLHNDPYLGKYLVGRRGRAFAIASIGAIDALNRTLAAAYAGTGVLSANVPAAFGTGDHRLVDLRGHGRVPADVARMCTMSWMCAPPPAGDNIHPNASGYRAIADALAAALQAVRTPRKVPPVTPSLPLATH